MARMKINTFSVGYGNTQHNYINLKSQGFQNKWRTGLPAFTWESRREGENAIFSEWQNLPAV